MPGARTQRQGPGPASAHPGWLRRRQAHRRRALLRARQTGPRAGRERGRRAVCGRADRGPILADARAYSARARCRLVIPPAVLAVNQLGGRGGRLLCGRSGRASETAPIMGGRRCYLSARAAAAYRAKGERGDPWLLAVCSDVGRRYRRRLVLLKLDSDDADAAAVAAPRTASINGWTTPPEAPGPRRLRFDSSEPATRLTPTVSLSGEVPPARCPAPDR